MIPLSTVYVTRENRTGDASIPSKIMSHGKTHAWKPFYYCKGNACSIFNVSIPYERHWVNGILTTTPNIQRNETFTDAYVREGCEHTEDYAHMHCIASDGVYLVCGEIVTCETMIICS